MVYAYKRALIKRCASPFNVVSKEISSHICNTAVTEKKKSLEDDTDDDNTSQESSANNEEEYFIDWDLDGIQKLLIEQGKLPEDTNWLNEELYPKIWRKLIHTIRSG